MLTLELLKKELAVATLQQKLGKEVSFCECVVYFNLSVLQTVSIDMTLQGSVMGVDQTYPSQFSGIGALLVLPLAISYYVDIA